MTESRKFKSESETTRYFLAVANEHGDIAGLLQAFIKEIQLMSGCEAVGIRLLDESGNIPYQSYVGFSKKFFEKESPLSIKSDKCMCINVIKGTTDPALSFYTPHGSFYSNGTTRLLATVSQEEKGETRNVCNAMGYESVALIPLRATKSIIGLIHLADRRENMVPLEMAQRLEQISTILGVSIQRVQAQEALRRSEAHLAKAEEISSFGHWEFNLDAGTVEASGGARIIYGLEDREMTIPDVQKIPLPEYREMLNIAFDGLVKRNEPYNVEFKVKRLSDGKVIDIHSIAEYDAKMNVVFGVIHDITERKKIEADLLKSEERFRRTFDQAPLGIAISGLDLRFIRVNHTMCQMFGYSEKELTSLTFKDITHPDDLSRDVEEVRRLTNGEIEHYEREKRYIRKDGTVFWGQLSVGVIKDDTGCPQYYTPLIADISQRKQAEEALRVSEQNYHSLFENMLHGVARCRMIFENGRPVDFIYLSVNPAFETLTGLKNATGKRVSELIPGVLETNPELFEIYGRVASTGVPESFEDYIEPLKTWFHVSVYSPQKGEFVATFDNITRRKQSELEVLRLNRLYAVISKVNQAVVHAASQEQFLDTVCGVVTEYGGFNLAWIGQISHESKQVLPVAVAGAAREYVSGIKVYIDERPEGRGPIGMSIRSLKPVIQNDFMNDANTKPWHDKAKALGLRGSAAFPILMGGQAWGALTVYSDSARYFGPKEINLLEEAAEDVGFALDNFKKEKLRAWAEEAMYKSSLELQKSEERFRSLYENSTIGIYRTTPDGRILLANPALLSMMGYVPFEELSESDLEGGSFEPSYPRGKFIEAIEKAGEIKGLESSWKRKDGSLIYVRESARAIRDEHGKTLYYDGTVEDVSERKQAEIALAEEIARRTKLFDQTPVGIVIIEPETARFLEFNAIAHTQLGYTRQEFARLSIHDVEAIETVEETRERMAGVLRGGKTEFETRMRTKKGELRDVQVTAQVVNIAGRIVYQCIWQDITERKRIDRLLCSERDRARQLLDIVGVIILTLDREGRVVLVNNKASEILGYEIDEVVGKDWVENFLPERRRLELKQAFKQLMSGDLQPDEYFENEILTSSGEERVIAWHNTVVRDEHGNITGSLSSGDDVTERKRVETALVESEEKFRNLAEQSPNIIFINVGGRIVYTNNKAVEMMGYSIEELYSAEFDFTSLVAPEYLAEMKQSFAKHMQGQEVSPLEYVVLTKTGKRIDSILATRLIDYRGERAILGTITDISERKKAEDERRRLEEKAQVASRLAAIGEMAAGIAHEINNPLTGVIGFSELLMEQELPSEAIEEVKIIADGSRRVADIVKRLLTFARQNKPVRTALNINALIENTLKLRAYVLQTTGINVVTSFDQGLPWLTADPGQLQQVFLNLIVNAEQAMKTAHNGGTLRIITEKFDGCIRIIFKDDGPGITKENLEKLFQPFFTTKGPGEGTGLGLSLSRSIILEHGGEIRVESQPGQGATFIIEIPLSDAIAPPEVAEASLSIEPSKQAAPARILIVDDELSVRNYLKATLTASGHTVDSTGDPEEALTMIDRNKYDAVFLDVRMPGMSGTELYGRILQKTPALTRKVIFMTGDTSDAGVRTFLTRNNLPYLPKPFEIEALEEKLRSCLEAD